MDQNFPIDIQLKKMTNWMENRRLCQKNWHDDVNAVRAKIASAIQDMPEHPTIKNLLSASNINYYSCKAILDVLKETEKDSKNILGMYTSTRITDWRSICQMYEKGNCYLPEASNYLNQAVLYEIPSLKKQVAKQEKQLNDLDKLEQSTKRKIAELKNERNADCAKMGIEGANPKRELLEIVHSLPNLYEQWLNDARPNLKPLMEKYVEAASNHRNSTVCLPTLSFLLQKGNVTAYEYIHGEAPLTVEEPSLINLEEETPEETPGEISLDLDLDLDLDPSTEAGEAEINWGDVDMDTTEDTNVDWSAVDDDLSSQIVIETSGTEGGSAVGQEAYSLLDNKRLRNLILDELSELSTFCQLKSIEISSQEKSFILNDSLGQDTEGNWHQLHQDVEEISSKLTSGQLGLLHQVKTSSTFVIRLVSEMEHKLAMNRRLECKVGEIDVKRQDCLGEAQHLQKSCQLVLEKTKLLQRQLEDDISARYNKRKVNILGGVQSLL